jgi:hypothetical protein
VPSKDKSRLPLTFKHDEVTFHVPTKLPPHALTFEHDAAPPLPTLPPAPNAPALLTLPPAPKAPPNELWPPFAAPPPPALAPPPDELENVPHAPEITANANTNAADWIFIEEAPFRGVEARSRGSQNRAQTSFPLPRV